MTKRFPKSQLEAKQQIILPLICLGINSEKYDQTIGTLPPTPSPLKNLNTKRNENVCDRPHKIPNVPLKNKAEINIYLRPFKIHIKIIIFIFKL